MLIYVKNFHTTLEGMALREVICENCGQEYLYLLEAQVRGSSSHLYDIGSRDGPTKAYADAEAKLAKQLEDGVDDAPCPRCGWVQNHMLPISRRRRKTDPVLLVGLLSTVGASIVILVFLLTWAVDKKDAGPVMLFGLSILVGPIALPVTIWRCLVDRRWSPNNSPVARRLAIAEEISITREEYLQMVQRGKGGIQEIADMLGKRRRKARNSTRNQETS
jgi:hypothetical protein